MNLLEGESWFQVSVWAAATYSKVYTCSDIDLGEVLFNYVIFCGKENRDLSS